VVAVLLVALSAGASGKTLMGEPNTPVTRVVKLLEGLSVETEEDGKKEKELYESFVCWAQAVVDTKTMTNAKAADRIKVLETYIADIDAGRIEFTTERQDLTKELEEIKGDIEAATALREKEHAEFLEAEEEMTMAITALSKAIGVLKVATEDHEEGVMMAQSQQTLRERVSDADSLSHALELGEKMLTAGDALFLRRILTGDVPTWDWKKLNRKATFKMSYKARSFKIQDVLSKMEKTFSASLADARAKEASAQELYDKLMETKREQEAATTEALQKMEKEMGARGMTKEESQAEVDALKEQIANDTDFIKQTQASLAEKKEEWKDRQELRAGELAAFSKAISILSNDDARDLMKRSFKSQGYAFLQENSWQARASFEARKGSAAEVLRKAAREAKDGRLAILATRLAAAAGSHFTEVIDVIDKMVATLKEEEGTDLERKETCEKNRAEDTRSAILEARGMDESTELIYKLMAEIAELKVQIEEKEEQKKKIAEELAEATRIREDEHAAWELTDKDDTDAATTVKAAEDVLTQFYQENNLMLVQNKKQPVIEAGAAPPPPPSTWDAPYGGKTEQGSGIIAILAMLHEDILQDQTKAKQAEEKAQEEFDLFKKESEAAMEKLSEEIETLEGTVASKEEEIEQETELRLSAKKELFSVMTTIKDAEPGCDYFCINYPLRLKNRQIEIDGLRKAKAILEGAAFTAEDPNRELKPGDAAAAALMQKKLRR
jgi:hypothetical protein